jgi:NADH dehydrogenase
LVGAHVCEKLARAGWTITVPTRRSTTARSVMYLPGLTVRECDVHDEATLQRLLQGHDAVVNLIAILHGSQQAFQRVHVELPRKLAAACVAADVKRLVHVSALGANPQAAQSLPSMYLRSKSEGEAVLMAACTSMALTVLRPSVIFGRGDKFLNLFAAMQQLAPFVPLACADAQFQPVWVEDVASAIVKALERAAPGVQAIEACGPDVFTLKQLVQLSAKLTGINHGQGRPVLPLPGWAGTLQARAMEMLPGNPLMSRDNLASMQVPNIASGAGVTGLESFGIQPAALPGVAADYLNDGSPWHALLGVRARTRRR